MLTAKTPFRSIVSEPCVPLMTQTRINGGSSETDVNELAVIPWWPSTPRVVITVTPVANTPRASRKLLLVKTCSSVAGLTVPCCTADAPFSSPVDVSEPVLRPRARRELVEALLDHLIEVLGCAERLGDEAAEGIAVQGEERRRGDCLHRRRPRHVPEDRH